MQGILITIKDTKAENFTPPYYFAAIGVMERELSKLPPENEMSKFAEDYEIWMLGSYDLQTGNIQLLESKTRMYTLEELMKTYRGTTNEIGNGS